MGITELYYAPGRVGPDALLAGAGPVPGNRSRGGADRPDRLHDLAGRAEPTEGQRTGEVTAAADETFTALRWSVGRATPFQMAAPRLGRSSADVNRLLQPRRHAWRSAG